jgi:hypothetical protein
MRRYTNWAWVFISGLFAIGAMTSTYWIPEIQPSLVEEGAGEEAFTCANYVTGEQCALLRQTYPVNPDLALAQQAALNPDLQREISDEDDLDAIAAEVAGTTSDPATVSTIKAGTFSEIDALRGAEGTASIYEISRIDGAEVRRFVYFESAFEQTFTIINGPDLYVYLSQAQNPITAEEMLAGSEGAVEVSILKGNIGQQYYELPNNVDLTRYNSVVIYSKQFELIYSVAPLATLGGDS